MASATRGFVTRAHGWDDGTVAPWHSHPEGDGRTPSTVLPQPEDAAIHPLPLLCSDPGHAEPQGAADDGEEPHDVELVDVDDSDGGVADSVDRKSVRRLLRGTKIWFESALRGVVVLNAKEIGFQQVRNPDDADVLWVEATNAAAQSGRMQAGMKPHQRVNFFPRMRHMATKCELARAVNRMAALYPGTDFSFVPQTFVIPGDERRLAALAAVADPTVTYVVKPSAGCGGDGIYLTHDITAVQHPECVVQEYIPNPLLLGGLKFDLRVYVLVTSVAPLRLYVCREGLCRMAVETYAAPSRKNYHRLNMHLTNYSLNKFSSNFVDNTNAYEDEACTKRSITTAFAQLAAEYGSRFDAEEVWEGIEDIAEKVLTVILPEVLVGAEEHSSLPMTKDDANGGTPTSRCFQLLGFDILLDDNLQPHLLEINHHPSLQTDAPIDMRVKGAVMKPLVRMIAYSAWANRRASRRKQQRAVGGHEEDPTLSIMEWEDRFRGDFRPCRDGAQYRFMIEPILLMKDRFLETCMVGSRVAGEMGRGRLLKFCRRMRWTQCDGAAFANSAEVELAVMKLKRGSATPAPNLTFYEFVQFLLEYAGSVLFPQDCSPTSPERLAHVASALATAPPPTVG